MLAGIRATGHSFGRVLHQLWLEVTGFTFLAIADRSDGRHARVRQVSVRPCDRAGAVDAGGVLHGFVCLVRTEFVLAGKAKSQASVESDTAAKKLTRSGREQPMTRHCKTVIESHEQAARRTVATAHTAARTRTLLSHIPVAPLHARGSCGHGTTIAILAIRASFPTRAACRPPCTAAALDHAPVRRHGRRRGVEQALQISAR